jgi:hypothetical protein
MVHNLSVFHSVHFEEIPFHNIRSSIIEAISDLNLLDHPPSVMEFGTLWNTDVSIVIKTKSSVQRKTRSLRSIVLSLFHDRRGKIAQVSRDAWRATYIPRTSSTTAADASTGVHSLTTNSSDCWGMIRLASSKEAVFLVVKRKFSRVGDVSDRVEGKPSVTAQNNGESQRESQSESVYSQPLESGIQE